MGKCTLVQRAVFLDRDGVINQAVVRDGKPYPPDAVEQVIITANAAHSLNLLKDAGFRLLVVTNQPDVARGKQKREVVEAINAHLMANLPLDQIYTCYHDDNANCTCRKPAPGLILQAAQEWQVNPFQSFLIGDRWKDIAAGREAGCTSFLIDMNYSETVKVEPHYRVDSLGQAVELIMKLT